MDDFWGEHNRLDPIVLSSIIGEWEELYHEAAVRLGVSDSALQVLYVLYVKGEGCTQADIGKMMGLSKQTVHSATHKMEREGVLYLQNGARRRMEVYLTEKGKVLMHATAQKVFEMENQIFASWNEEEREAYLRLNRKYCDAFAQQLDTLGHRPAKEEKT